MTAFFVSTTAADRWLAGAIGDAELIRTRGACLFVHHLAEPRDLYALRPLARQRRPRAVCFRAVSPRVAIVAACHTTARAVYDPDRHELRAVLLRP